MKGSGRRVVVVQSVSGFRRKVDAVSVGESRHERAQDLSRPDADLLGELLRGEVRAVQVVLVAVEEVADLLVRRARGVVLAAPAVRHLREPFGQEPVAAAQIEQDLGHTRHP